MNPDQAPNARHTLKRVHEANSDDTHSGDTPAAKRNKPCPDPESESKGMPTLSKPTKPTTTCLKAIPLYLKGKKRTAHNTPSPPQSTPPPATLNFSRDITLDITSDIISPTCEGLPPAAFTDMTSPTGDPADPADASSPIEFPPSPTKESEPDTVEMDMGMESPPPVEPSENGPEWDVAEIDLADVFAIWGSASRTQLNSTELPKPTGEWHIVRKDLARPDLDHQLDNPFNFLPTAKLENILRFIKGQQEVEASKLSEIEKMWYGRPQIKKILVKVVYSGTNPIKKNRRTTWFRAVMYLAIAQSRGKVAKFNKLMLAFDPLKPGYRWVVVPVRAGVFKALEGVRSALDLKSGTLVLFRIWDEKTSPKLRAYAIRLHLEIDEVSFDRAAEDYHIQMKKALDGVGLQILEMKLARHGDIGTYTTEIVLGFKEGTIPFLLDPALLMKKFKTGQGNQKKTRWVEYRWPAKCRMCKSEAHLTSACPWLHIEIAGRKPNLLNCRFHPSSWVEPTKGQKRTVTNPLARLLNIGPKGKPRRDSTGADKGKG